MQTHAKTLLAPLAAVAIAGALGAAPAEAHGGGHPGYGQHGYGHHHGHHGHRGHDARAAEIVTSDETAAAFAQAGVDVSAVDPATAHAKRDGTTELSFPRAEDGERWGKRWSKELDFEGGVTYASDVASSTWLDPSVDTKDGSVSFQVSGQRVDLLQVVPEGDDGDGDGDHQRAGRHGHDDEFDLTLAAEGAAALNQVTGGDSFAAGDVFADTDEGHDC